MIRGKHPADRLCSQHVLVLAEEWAHPAFVPKSHGEGVAAARLLANETLLLALERARAVETVGRLDRAADLALKAFAQLAKTGSLKKEIREEAEQALLLARNEVMEIEHERAD